MHRSSEDHPLITSIHLVKSRVEAEYCVFKPNLLLLSTFCVDLVGTDGTSRCPYDSQPDFMDLVGLFVVNVEVKPHEI
jgi:hypothetical protein